MQKPLRASLTLLIVLAAAAPAFSATFIVPSDREMVRRAHAIVVATPLASYTQLNAEGGIETVTPVRVEEVIKGRNVGQSLTLVEPGGEYEGRAMLIPGVPRFETSERVVLFIVRTGRDRWAVAEIALGKFSFKQAGKTSLLLRDANEINGWDPDGTPHEERSREASRFLQFLKAESSGAISAEDYFVSDTVAPLSAPALQPRSTGLRSPIVQPLVAPYTATSYTMLISGNMGGRWAIFPNPVTFFSGTTQEAGAPGGGTTAINAAFASWDNDCGSNVNYVYGGTDNGTHTQGLHAADGANTILFERDLSSWGVAPFTCSGSSYGGTLGVGGVTDASGTNVVNGETFATTQEADVEMNRGIANCSLLFNNGDFNSAVTHEVGHTLGFRHSDQTRNSGAACTTDPSLECSSQAIMKSFISTGINAALQVWDQHAVQAVYPGNVCAPTSTPPPPPSCTPPSITSQPASTTINSGSSATLSVGAAGTAPLSYQWYTGPSGTTTSPVAGGTGPSITVAPTSTTSYWVRVSNSCGAVNSAAATVTVPAAPPPPTTVAGKRYDLNGDGRADIFWWYAPNGNTADWLMNGTTKAQSAIVEVSPLQWRAVGIGDFDGDGKADILWRHTETGQNAIWFMNGLVKRLGVIIEGAPLVWDVVGVADFNGDGKADILWRTNDGSGQDAMWLMNGSTKTLGSIIEGAPGRWKVVGTGDFDGDGKADILWRDPQTGEDAMWLMNGTAKAVGAIIETSPVGWSVGGVGDFNGDGKADIFWRHANGSDAMWLMNGPTKTVGEVIEYSPTNWQLVEIGDFNGDGKADVLWRDPSNGNNAMWLMNGTAKTLGAIIEGAPVGWQVIQ
jgi:hypothetical protein